MKVHSVLLRGGVFGLAIGLLAASAPTPTSAALPLPVRASATVSSPIAVSPGKQTTALSSTFTTTEATNIRATGWLSITNNGKKAATVTVTTDANTKIRVNGQDAKFADIKPGMRVVASPNTGTATKVVAMTPKKDKNGPTPDKSDAK